MQYPHVSKLDLPLPSWRWWPAGLPVRMLLWRLFGMSGLMRLIYKKLSKVFPIKCLQVMDLPSSVNAAVKMTICPKVKLGHMGREIYNPSCLQYCSALCGVRCSTHNCETQPPASIGWVALSSVVCLSSSRIVTPHLISTIWCFRPYKPYIFCEDMILAICQCHSLLSWAQFTVV